MTVERTPPDDSDDRVVNFRPRGGTPSSGSPQDPAQQNSPVEDLKKFEEGEGDDDYRHRMITNVIALAFTALLVLAGVWMANTLAEMRKNQDCVLSGRRGCTPVEAPIRER